MNTLVSGRSIFARNSVCPKAKRKTWVAILAVYVGAAAIATAAIALSR